MAGEEFLDRLELIGLHAEQKAVRRVGRRRAPPRLDEIVAREAQEQYRRETQCQARHLHRIAARMAAQIGETVAQRPVCRPQSAEQAQGHPGDGEKHEHGERETADDVGAEFDVARLPDEQRREQGKPEPIRCDGAALWRASLAAHDAQRRHVLELDQRRQREAEQQHQADQQSLQRRPERRRR